MSQVSVEMFVNDGWIGVAALTEEMPPGSTASEDLDGRQVYMFGWLDNDGPAVWRSVLGFDIDTPLDRDVGTADLEKLADLTEGPFEIEWRQGLRAPLRLRFRLTESP